MRRALAAALGAAAVLLPAASAQSSTSWSGNFQNGKLTQWTRAVAVPGDVEIVRSVHRETAYAAKITLHPGDRPTATNERAELLASRGDADGVSGASVWYGWSILFPSGFTPAPGFNIFTQWLGARDSPDCAQYRSPNIALKTIVTSSTTAPTYVFKVQGGPASCFATRRVYPVGTLARGVWHDFVLHVVWSSDAAKGLVSIWVDGRWIVQNVHEPTLWAGSRGVFLKQGVYRRPARTVETVYLAATKRGHSFSAVLPRGSATPAAAPR